MVTTSPSVFPPFELSHFRLQGIILVGDILERRKVVPVPLPFVLRVMLLENFELGQQDLGDEEEEKQQHSFVCRAQDFV